MAAYKNKLYMVSVTQHIMKLGYLAYSSYMANQNEKKNEEVSKMRKLEAKAAAKIKEDDKN